MGWPTFYLVLAAFALGFAFGRRSGWRRALKRASWIVMTRSHSVPPEARFDLAAEVQDGLLPKWVDGAPGGQWTERDRDCALEIAERAAWEAGRALAPGAP